MSFTTNERVKYAPALPLRKAVDEVLAYVQAFQGAGPAVSPQGEGPALPPPALTPQQEELLALSKASEGPVELAPTLVRGELAVAEIGAPAPWKRFQSTCYSAFPTRTRWAIKVQGGIQTQTWDFLRSPWLLEDRELQRKLAHADFLNRFRARRLTKKERRRLNQARRVQG